MSFVLDIHEVISKMGEDFSILSLGTSLKDIWKTPNGVFISPDNDSIIIPDISNWLPNTLVLNKKAHDLLLEHVADYGEMLDVNIESNQYYVFNIINKVDDSAIDYDKSQKLILNDVEVGVKKLVFYAGSISEDILLFKTSYDNGANIFCSEKFKKLVEVLGLTGITFDTKLAIDPMED
jgi:hypothetical protein